jgi:N-acetylmuramoyl-L-alanine amidase
VVIEVSDEFTYRSDHLPNPDRLFFDIVGAKPTTGPKISTTPVGDSIVRQIRVAETQPGTTRVVLDLEGDSAFTVTRLSSPERLIVEIGKPQAEENPLASTKKVFEAPSAIHTKPEFGEQPRLDPPPAMASNVPTLPPSLRQIPREVAASIPPRPAPARPAQAKPVPVTIAGSKPHQPQFRTEGHQLRRDERRRAISR